MAQITIQEALNKIADAIKALDIKEGDKAKWETDITNLKSQLSTLSNLVNTKADNSSITDVNNTITSLTTSLNNLSAKVTNLHHHEVHFFKSLTDPELTKIDTSTFKPGEVIYIGTKAPYEAYIWAKDGGTTYGWKHTGKANTLNITDYYKKTETDALLKTIRDTIATIKSSSDTAHQVADAAKTAVDTIKPQVETNKQDILDLKSNHQGSLSEIVIKKGEYRWFPTNYTPDTNTWEKVTITNGFTIVEGTSEGTTTGQTMRHDHKYYGPVHVNTPITKDNNFNSYGINGFSKSAFSTQTGSSIGNLPAGIKAKLYKAKKDIYVSNLSQSQIKDIQKISQMALRLDKIEETQDIQIRTSKDNYETLKSIKDEDAILVNQKELTRQIKEHIENKLPVIKNSDIKNEADFGIYFKEVGQMFDFVDSNNKVHKNIKLTAQVKDAVHYKAVQNVDGKTYDWLFEWGYPGQFDYTITLNETVKRERYKKYKDILFTSSGKYGKIETNKLNNQDEFKLDGARKVSGHLQANGKDLELVFGSTIDIFLVGDTPAGSYSKPLHYSLRKMVPNYNNLASGYSKHNQLPLLTYNQNGDVINVGSLTQTFIDGAIVLSFVPVQKYVSDDLVIVIQYNEEDELA